MSAGAVNENPWPAVSEELTPLSSPVPLAVGVPPVQVYAPPAFGSEPVLIVAPPTAVYVLSKLDPDLRTVPGAPPTPQ